MARFTLPRDLYHGKGVMKQVLSGLKGKKAIIVTGGSSMRKGGFLDKDKQKNKKAKTKTFLFLSLSPHSEKVKKIIVREVCRKEISFVQH